MKDLKSHIDPYSLFQDCAMEGETAVTNLMSVEQSIESLDCRSLFFLNYGVVILNKTWRIFSISPVPSTVQSPAFLEHLSSSVRSEFQRYFTMLGEYKLQKVLIHPLDDVQGFDYALAFYLGFTSGDYLINLQCCMFAQFANSIYPSHSIILV